jgi:hypothetical protein
MASSHFTRDYVWVVNTSLSSVGLNYQGYRNLGITGIYLNADDGNATNAKRLEAVGQGFKVGLFAPKDSRIGTGTAAANAVSDRLGNFAPNDAGQTSVLLDLEPDDGASQFWKDFIVQWRGSLRPGRVTDFTPSPFKGTALPAQALLDARFDVVVQTYFGDMSPVDAHEATQDWRHALNGAQFPEEAIHTFVDGGRKNKPPIFYLGGKVRNLMPGTVIWNANLLREAGLA